MKKHYEKPDLQVQQFDVCDVITTASSVPDKTSPFEIGGTITDLFGAH